MASTKRLVNLHPGRTSWPCCIRSWLIPAVLRNPRLDSLIMMCPFLEELELLLGDRDAILSRLVIRQVSSGRGCHDALRKPRKPRFTQSRSMALLGVRFPLSVISGQASGLAAFHPASIIPISFFNRALFFGSSAMFTLPAGSVW